MFDRELSQRDDKIGPDTRGRERVGKGEGQLRVDKVDLDLRGRVMEEGGVSRRLTLTFRH